MNRFKAEATLTHCFHFYKSNLKKGKQKVTEREYRMIMTSFFMMIRELVVKGHEIVLPDRSGILKVVGSKRGLGKENVSWVATKKLWEQCPECKERNQVVNFDNDHTDGIIYRVLWGREKLYAINKHPYGFRPCKAFRKLITKEIKTNNREYPNVPKKEF